MSQHRASARNLAGLRRAHGAYPTIGEALVAAPDNAVITIAAGEYAETLEITGLP